jgi:hypothetical protein
MSKLELPAFLIPGKFRKFRKFDSSSDSQPGST